MNTIHLKCPDCEQIDAVSLSCAKHGWTREVREFTEYERAYDLLAEQLHDLEYERARFQSQLALFKPSGTDNCCKCEHGRVKTYKRSRFCNTCHAELEKSDQSVTQPKHGADEAVPKL